MYSGDWLIACFIILYIRRLLVEWNSRGQTAAALSKSNSFNFFSPFLIPSSSRKTHIIFACPAQHGSSSRKRGSATSVYRNQPATYTWSQCWKQTCSRWSARRNTQTPRSRQSSPTIERTTGKQTESAARANTRKIQSTPGHREAAATAAAASTTLSEPEWTANRTKTIATPRRCWRFRCTKDYTSQRLQRVLHEVGISRRGNIYIYIYAKSSR